MKKHSKVILKMMDQFLLENAAVDGGLLKAICSAGNLNSLPKKGAWNTAVMWLGMARPIHSTTQPVALFYASHAVDL